MVNVFLKGLFYQVRLNAMNVSFPERKNQLKAATYWAVLPKQMNVGRLNPIECCHGYEKAYCEDELNEIFLHWLQFLTTGRSFSKLKAKTFKSYCNEFIVFSYCYHFVELAEALTDDIFISIETNWPANASLWKQMASCETL